MFRPTAWVESRNTIPSVFSISPKYSCGLTRTSAPVGQFSSHEYDFRFAPSGFNGVASHRLHLIATMSSASLIPGGGGGVVSLKARRNLVKKGGATGASVLRGTMVIAS